MGAPVGPPRQSLLGRLRENVYLTSFAFAVLVAAGGWVWSLAGHAAALAALSTRVASLETAAPGEFMFRQTVVDRLARIEGQLSEIVRELHHGAD